MTTTIDLIRHGEPVGGSRYRGGGVDDPLSENGWAQMRAAVGDHCPWQAIYTSPLVRCRAFAAELAARHGVPLRVDERLREIGYGEWEGRAHAEVQAEDPGLRKRLWLDPVVFMPPGAESLESARARMTGAWEDILDRHPGEQVLVVAHAGVIRMLLSQMLGMPLERLFSFSVSYAALSRVAVDAIDGARLQRLLFHGATRLPGAAP